MVQIAASEANDATALKRALAQSNAKLKSILDTVPEAAIIIDASGRIETFNHAAEQLFGYQETEVIGKNVNMLMPEPHRSLHGQYLKRYLQTGEKRIIGFGRVVEGRKKDGSTFPMQLSVGEAKAGKRTIFTGFARDLTQQKANEQQIDQLNTELAHASRLSEVGTLASALAHELNQPLTAIANYLSAGADLAGRGQADDIEFMREAFDEAAKEAVRAGKIVRRLRDYVAKGEVEKERVALEDVINDALVIGLVGANPLGIQWSLAIDPETNHVLANRIQIQQVLVNLMRNAIEAMAQSHHRKLSIVARVNEDQDMTEVILTDTGPGISPDIIKRLFEPFNTSKAQGMGIGLSICKTIIEDHGGKIWGTNYDQGALFGFSLPRASQEVE